jgi:hypothetical protein
MSPTLKDITTGETRRIHICYQCDPDIYPKGKPIDSTDWKARPDEKGNWICGDCQVEELNKRKIRVLGPNHPEVKAFMTKEDNDCKSWNNYVKKVNQHMRVGLKYKRNRYTGRIPFI